MLCIIALQTWLTVDACMHRLICRGLVRIHCAQLLARVWHFLTAHGVINAGVVRPQLLASPRKVACLLLC